LSTNWKGAEEAKTQDNAGTFKDAGWPAHSKISSSSSSAGGAEPIAAMASKSLKISGPGKEETWDTVVKLRANKQIAFVRRFAFIDPCVQ
jgi:hypothetical protein